jgi:glycogen debranching enzyme
MTLTFSMAPDMERMWPAANEVPVQPEWVASAPASGYYLLHLNTAPNTAAIAMPTAEASPKMPYQERTRAVPLQFLLRFDPARDSGKVYPLLIALADTPADTANIGARLQALNAGVEDDYAASRAYAKQLLARSLTVETPNAALNDAFKWAILSMDQLRVATGSYPGEQAYTAGVLESSDSIRPGYGWYFGRDALWSIYALDSLGQYKNVKDELEFLLRRQSSEGKILHEWSQTADLVNWQALPYAYAEADATPLLQMAVRDYLRVSGDTEFVRSHWDALERAWNYQDTHDADGDGIYDNAQGTAWVESWPGGMPKQEIYLAVLDEQASLAFADLAQATGHTTLEQKARARAARIVPLIEREYLATNKNFYAFSWNGTQGADQAATIFPSVAWWDGSYALAHAEPMISRWASEEFSTDWGTRLISDKEKIYDPISYHQGSVWPLFTGWVSLAEYRSGHALAGYAHLMQNANLTWGQDLGNHTEVLSGAFFKPLQCSSAHQLWSSAMVISPALRGMFGFQWDEAAHTLYVAPQLPADWNEATVRNVPLGDAHVDLHMVRTPQGLSVDAVGAASDIQLRSRVGGARAEARGVLIPLPPVEVGIDTPAPELGQATKGLKVLGEKRQPHRLELTVEGAAGRDYLLYVRENRPLPQIRAEGVMLGEALHGVRKARVHFDAGAEYQQRVLVISW